MLIWLKAKRDEIYSVVVDTSVPVTSNFELSAIAEYCWKNFLGKNVNIILVLLIGISKNNKV